MTGGVVVPALARPTLLISIPVAHTETIVRPTMPQSVNVASPDCAS